jgi:hypothetical protein
MEYFAAANQVREQPAELRSLQLLAVLLRHPSFKKDSSVLLPLLSAFTQLLEAAAEALAGALDKQVGVHMLRSQQACGRSNSTRLWCGCHICAKFPFTAYSVLAHMVDCCRAAALRHCQVFARVMAVCSGLPSCNAGLTAVCACAAGGCVTQRGKWLNFQRTQRGWAAAATMREGVSGRSRSCQR